MPAIFFGHGNPMNALQHNAYTEGWASIGASIPRPKAVLAVSAHWYIPATAVTASATPRTIHFENRARELLLVGDDAPLIAYESFGRDAMLSIPTPEHYLPLLYVMALRREGDQVSFPVEGVDCGSISMMTIQIG